MKRTPSNSGEGKEIKRIAVLDREPSARGESIEKGEEQGRDRAAPAGAGPGRILLASTDPREVRTLRSILSAEPWAIVSASGGEEALREIARGREEEPGSPHLILMGLPLSGPYGRLILDSAGEAGTPERWPLMALIREGYASERRQALEAGADQAVMRPIDADDMLSRARVLVQLHRLRLCEAAAREMGRAAQEELADLKHRRAAFAGKLAHDLKSPLTGIMGTAQLLQMKLGSAHPDLDGYAVRILGAAHQVQRTLADLRDLGLLEEGRFRMNIESIDLHATLNLIMEDHRGEAEANGVELELVPSRPDARRGPAMLRADADLLLRLLGNLVTDAVRHSPPEGRVRVMVGSPGDGRAEIHISNLADEVHDYAAGLYRNAGAIRNDDAVEARLEGGLRAAFCRAVVRALDGRIWVKPNAAGGSTVGLLLPAERGMVE